ncbi:purine-binding chemotaxis protein CheW [Peteryoungia desertarenae]|uniref:Purine-binding chemotaxis protein CheW n=1 Tax=Peteryoungia desertarenae TaxID=1813451 RepID=A0ABX6QNL2_9HYPH|nr:chemotaxis protein CheW [Peteryoungia desertarenae]QLF69842.1 purine-binding chemotaxis protein CheW [Peteryoungia desertarenae]
MNIHASSSTEFLEIIAFKLNDQSFCVKTRSIREIRGWVPVTPMPHAPYEVLGVINLRGMVIPIIDLAVKLGMGSTEASERSAIIVTDVNDMTMGLLVEGVSDILTVPVDSLQPVPHNAGQATQFVDGILTHQDQMICFLNLEELFAKGGPSYSGGGSRGGGGGEAGWEEF